MASFALAPGSRPWGRPDVVRGAGRAPAPRLSTGFATLDRCLPEGGWPLGALTEVLCDLRGIGELQLVMPALAELTRSGRSVVWVSPPHVPYAPALEAQGVVLSRVLWIGSPDRSERLSRDHLWAAEQALRQPGCGAVLLWLRACPREDRVLRRLQIAAEAGGSWGVLFRPAAVASRPSPASVRVRLETSVGGTSVEVLKCRGRAPLTPVVLA